MSVKGGKESHDVDVDTTMPGLVFKNQLYSLTGVPPDRQKIMVKGGMLKDDADLGKLNLKPKQKLMMMGTADKVPSSHQHGCNMLPATKAKLLGCIPAGNCTTGCNYLRTCCPMQLPDAPTNAPVFMEDLPEEEQDVTGYAKYGAGKCSHGHATHLLLQSPQNPPMQCLAVKISRQSQL